MSAAGVGQIIKRIPLIKFRYVKSFNGWWTESPAAASMPAAASKEIQKAVKKIPIELQSDLPTGLAAAAVQPAVSSSYNGVSSSSKTPTNSKEFYQLSQKYRRAPISDYEMSIINNGGPE